MAVIRYHDGRFRPERLDWDRLVPYIGPANAAVARYDGMLAAIHNAFAEQTHSQYAIHALDWVFERPVFKSLDFVRSANIPKPTAKRILQVLKQKKILKIVSQGGGRKSAVLAYSELLNIAEGHDVF